MRKAVRRRWVRQPDDIGVRQATQSDARSVPTGIPIISVVDLVAWQLWWKHSGARELRGILMSAWDPIGVRGVPEAADEYDGYLAPVVQRLKAGGTVDDIASFLGAIAAEDMELEPDIPATQAAARALVAWYAKVG